MRRRPASGEIAMAAALSWKSRLRQALAVKDGSAAMDDATRIAVVGPGALSQTVRD